MKKLLLLLLFPIFSYAATSSTTLLFTQLAHSATLQPAQHGWYRLSLKGISPSVTWFSNRPVRKTGIMPLTQFIQHWNTGKNSFASDNPNAALVYLTEHHGVHAEEQTIVKLRTPKYMAKNHTLIYQAKILGGHPIEIHKGKEVALFIDHAPCAWLIFKLLCI